MIPTILSSAHCSTLDWFYSLPTLVVLRASSYYNGASLCCSQGLQHSPQCSICPAQHPYTLYLLHTPLVQPPGKKAQRCFLSRVRFLLHAPCTCYMVQNLQTIHSRVWSSWIFINLSIISYHFYQAISSTEVGMSSLFCSPSQSQLLEQCLARRSVLSRFSCVCATLWTAACQALRSMGFSRQKYWSELPCPSPEHRYDPGID